MTQGFFPWVIRYKKTRSRQDGSATHRSRSRHNFGNTRSGQQHLDFAICFSKLGSRNALSVSRDNDSRSVAQMPVFPGLRAFLGDAVIMAQMQQKPSTGPTQKPATPSYKPAAPTQPKTGGSPPMTGPGSPKPGQPGQPSQPPKK